MSKPLFIPVLLSMVLFCELTTAQSTLPKAKADSLWGRMEQHRTT